jgi:hypothetical protein
MYEPSSCACIDGDAIAGDDPGGLMPRLVRGTYSVGINLLTA